MSEQVRNEPPQRNESGYLQVAGALLLVIIVCLSVLWLREHGARLTAQQQAAASEARLQKLAQVLAALPTTVPASAVEPVNRQDLPQRTVQVGDQRRTVLSISAAAGARFGFRPGDIIEVAAMPSTEPSRP